MNDLKAKLARHLMALSYVQGEVTLTSGRKSDYYFDCKQTALHPEGGYLIGKLFLEMLKGTDARGVAGMTLGADPLVTAVSLVSFLEGQPLPAFIVRKESKKHGTEAYIEGQGNIPAGARVALVEDVVTTGGTLLKVIERVERQGYRVGMVIAVVDRQEGGAEALAAAGCPLTAIFTRAELLG